jgi:nitrite reductase/ring-hydroxylating ferredoxin subunit
MDMAFMSIFLKFTLAKIKRRVFYLERICFRYREASMLTATGVARGAVEEAGKKVIRRAAKQVLLIAHEGEIFAIANRCPHEGYPLSEGTLGPGCVLTCNWHNWKFDLSSGEALVGRDPVRRYQLAFAGDGEILLDLSDPPPEAQRRRALKGLEAALADYDRARMARETVRLAHAGFSAREAVVHAISSSAERFEDGMTHAHAAAADWLSLSDGANSEEKRLAAMLEPIGHVAWDMRGADSFPFADEVRAWNVEGFVAAIEAEREADAIAFVRGALREGRLYSELRPAFARAALAHYADFGHSAIYVLKAGELIARLGEAVAEPVMLLLTRSLVRATREEKLPEFRSYAKALRGWSEGGDAPIAADDLARLNVEAMLARVLQSSQRPVRESYEALLGAAAWNLLHFDLRADQASDNALADNVGWLDFTHALTFANATRQLSEETPELWPAALLQMALFAARNAKYVSAEDDGRWSVADPMGFIAREKAKLYDHATPEPIVACHRVKMLTALAAELEAAPDAVWGHAMCAGVNRYLNSPLKRHHGLRIASQALDFIAKEA